MSDLALLYVLTLAGWSAMAINSASNRLGRIADALEALVALAKRGRP